MNFRRTALIVCLFGLLTSNQLMAQKRITDMNGREVRIGSRVAPQTTQTVKAASLHPRASAVVNVSAGADTSAAVNDYRRIQNALDAAGNGDIIILSGTFDFTQPFAAAEWAKGDDGVASTADDYEVLAPRGINNVVLTANAPGTATIQGPGDLAAINLEAFLVFDPSVAPGGANQNWVISNLRILDFDLSIGMFAVGTSDFNNTLIATNFIRIPTDLNATVAPADTVQNIGINFSFGTNQSITGNTFQIAGDGVSDTGAGNFSTSVVMQSNTGSSNTYDGLNISQNLTHILNAQSANPQVTLGIWDNCHAHTSNITISGNSFVNDAAGNSPSLNLERAYRVTSHSGAASTVTYSNNLASGANIGFQWLAAANFAGNQAIVMSGNIVTSCDTGLLIQSNGIAHLETNTITGSGAGGGLHLVTGTLTASGANTNSVFRNFITGGSADGILIDATASAITDPMTQNDFSGNTGFGLNNLSATGISATLNWWGNNLTANVAAEVNGNVTFDPWLASGSDVSGLAGFQPFIYATTTTAGNLTTLAGTGAADTGAALAGSPNTTFQMDGDTGLVVTAQLVSLSIQPGGSDDVFTLGALGVPTTFDGGAGNDTLIGTNIAQTWNITAANSGNIPGVATSFSNTESLRGGTAADSFVFGAAGSVAMSIDGNLGVDTLDNSAIPGHVVNPTGPGTLDGFQGTATGVGTTFDNINVVGAPADVAVVKTGPASANASTVISYTITVTNNGPNPAINATLNDTIPAGTTFSSLVSPGGWSCSTPSVNSTGTVTCTNSSMAVGPAVFTLNVNGPAGTATVSNTASVSSASADGTPGNNSSTANTSVTTTADVSITKTPAPGPYGTSGPLTYTIAVNNAGPGAAASVVVTDILPAGTTLSSANPSQGSCSGTTTVTCNLGTINSLGSATIALTITLPSTAGPVSNTATVATSSTDPNPANNSSTSVVTVVASSNIPATSPMMLLLLVLTLAIVGAVVQRLN